MEILIIKSNKKLAEEKVSSPSVIMKNAETQTEDSIIFRSIETQTEKDANKPSSISVSSPKILVSSATPASSSTISPHTPRRGAAAASPNPSPRAVMFERRISPGSLRDVRDGLTSPNNQRPGTSQRKAKEIYFCEMCDMEAFKTFVRHSMTSHRTPPSKRKLDYFYQFQYCDTESKKKKKINDEMFCPSHKPIFSPPPSTPVAITAKKSSILARFQSLGTLL